MFYDVLKSCSQSVHYNTYESVTFLSIIAPMQNKYSSLVYWVGMTI